MGLSRSFMYNKYLKINYLLTKKESLMEKKDSKLEKVDDELKLQNVEEINGTEELPDEQMEEVEGGWCFCLGGNTNTTPAQPTKQTD